jgi:hypothetical protein
MLSRAVGLVNLDQTDAYIAKVLQQRWPQATDQQTAQIIALARAGVAFVDSIDWNDPTFVIDLTKAPQLPP